MNREEILERNKRSSIVDEGEQYIEDRSRNIGEIGIIFFFIVLFAYKIWRGIPSEDLVGLFWGYLSFIYIGKLKYCRRKIYFAFSIVSMIGAMVFIVSYILKTW
ncbi:MAG: DUF6442 family protein [Clostridium sp.]